MEDALSHIQMLAYLVAVVVAVAHMAAAAAADIAAAAAVNTETLQDLAYQLVLAEGHTILELVL